VARHNRSEKNDDDLDEMREAFRKHKTRAKGGGGENSWDKLQEGKNNRRILPRPGERKFYTEGWTHFRVGPNDRAVRCIDEKHINPERGLPESGTRCPICKKFLREQARINSEYKKGDEDGQAEWGKAKEKYVPRHQFYTNVLVPDDDEEVSVMILAFGPQIWESLMGFYLGDDSDIGDFTHPETGRFLNIKKVKKSRDRRNVEYTVFPASDTVDISDSWSAIKKMLHDLDAAAGKIRSKEEVIAIMKGEDVDEEEDDDDSDDDDASNAGSDQPRRRKSRRDDDEDDEDEEDDSDDDDVDDDDRPVKEKSSKLALKMGKRRRDREDD
jgi:hypothetical protein